MFSALSPFHPPHSLSLFFTDCNISFSFLYSPPLSSVSIFLSFSSSPDTSSLLYFVHFSFSFYVTFLSSSFSFANVDVCLPLPLSLSLSLFLSGFPTPCQHHPLLPPLLPTMAERQSTEWPQFEHASLRITKGLSVRRFHPRRRFLFSFLRVPFGLTLSPSLFLFLSLVFPLLFSLSSLFLPIPAILLSSSFSRSSRATDVRSAIERRSILPFKWIRHATGQTDAPPRYHRSSCRSRSFSIANVAAGWHFGRPGNCDLAPVDRRLVHTEILDFTSTCLPLRPSLWARSMRNREESRRSLRNPLTVHRQRNDTPRPWNVHYRVCLGQRQALLRNRVRRC